MASPLRQLRPDEFPPELLELPSPPDALWMRGAWPEKGTRLLAVVGSRALSSYGREACEKLIMGLRGYPISIVSGLALGTDACAHRAALKAGLHTIAVPGSGLDDASLYPRTNAGLAADILAAGGALLSEHPGDYRPRVYDFPSRNRLMVGLAHAVLVIEAGERSGTLITARLTHEYNRELLCVPHRIGDVHGFGAHLFLRLGAALAAEPAHILEALRIEPEKVEQKSLPLLSGNEQALYELLAEPRTRDELIRRAALPPGEVLTTLISLELKGIAKEVFGAWRRI